MRGTGTGDAMTGTAHAARASRAEAARPARAGATAVTVLPGTGGRHLSAAG
ncbi:predicted protein [Streptomyces viridosporus ATCC 14672]|uniref:Predicted protein n=1 Tax=Streptomyces viridosporus (strain ATCC 14672 / DSM 40746 / JCM 4963 / KCTC 9882 / NRRL B-12104 / FH 1290) TaxID=566461 RepID=D6AA88_STRV1|nr:predicted protein [Streptomyces viridosporus ATCC 14672]